MTARPTAPRGVPRRRRPPMIIHRARGPARGVPTRTPLDAVLVALDSAKCTGYAIYIRGRLHHYGEVNARMPIERAAVFTEAIHAATMRGLPIGVVLEVPWGGYQSAALSLHATATAWRETWFVTGQPVEHMIERTAGEWRRVLFGGGGSGRGGGRALPRAQARHLERVLAEQVVERDLGPRRFGKPALGPDAAAAVCIGQTIIRSGELVTLLGCGCVAPDRRPT